MDDQEPIALTLQRIPWFREFSPDQISDLAQITSLRSLKEGEILFSEGDTEGCLYILLEGKVVSETHIPGRGNTELYSSDPLDIIGWSVLTPVVRQRTATAKATEKTRILCINSLLLRQMCDKDHDLGYIIMRRIANVVASRLLSTRLQLFGLLHQGEATTQITNR